MTKRDDDNEITFFASEVADLDWLNVDEKAYRNVETLPRKNLDIVPDLEKMWNHSNDPVNVGYEPTLSGGTQAGDIQVTALDRALTATTTKNVVKFAVETLYKGASPQDFVRALRSKFAVQDLELARKEVTALTKEIGLLGHVYVTASLYPRCAQGEGKQEIGLAKDAQLLIKKAACDGCASNHSNRCAVYQKDLVASVNYDQKLVGQYQELYQIRGKKASTDGRDPKTQLRSLILSSKLATEIRQSSFKPVEKTLVANVSTEEALVQIGKAKQARETVLSNDKLYRSVALKMMSRELSSELRAKIATVSHPRLDILKANESFVGSVWVDLGPFDNCEVQAKSFLAKHASSARYVTKTSRCDGCQHFAKTSCNLFNKEIVSSGEDVPYTKELAASYIEAHVNAGVVPVKVGTALGKALVSHDPKEVLTALFQYRKADETRVYAGSEPVKEKKAVTPTELANYLRDETRRSEEQRSKVDISDRTFEPIVASIRDGLKRGLPGPVLAKTLQEKYGSAFLAESQFQVSKKLAEEGLLEKLREAFFFKPLPVTEISNPLSDFEIGSMNLEIDPEHAPQSPLDFQLRSQMNINEDE